MDESGILSQTLGATLQRQSKLFQNYETEIANLTVEIFRLNEQVKALSAEDTAE